MRQELEQNGVDVRINCNVTRIEVEQGRVQAVCVNGRRIPAACVISNANVKSTIFDLVGELTSARVSSKMREPCG